MQYHHPDSDQVIDVSPDVADVYESQGWMPVLSATPDGPVVDEEEPVKTGPKQKENRNG